ncbi:MAG: hypothetical protein WBM83_03815 [Flavobacteriaceae bacterium]
MKKLAYLILICTSFLLGTTKSTAQNKVAKKEVKVQKHTLLERFEPEIVLTAEERVQLKEDRLATVERTEHFLDTLDISDRKRKRLMRDLKRSPIFTERLSKVIAENNFVDDPEDH